MINSINDCTKLNNGLEMPWLGFGVFLVEPGEETELAVERALEAGYRSIDTAAIYGCGHSETVVGRALKQTSNKPIVATKCSLLWNDKREKSANCLKAQSVRDECHASLKRLDIDTIDLYQIHWPWPPMPVEFWVDAVADAVDDGLVKAVGVSN